METFTEQQQEKISQNANGIVIVIVIVFPILKYGNSFFLCPHPVIRLLSFVCQDPNFIPNSTILKWFIVSALLTSHLRVPNVFSFECIRSVDYHINHLKVNLIVKKEKKPKAFNSFPSIRFLEKGNFATKNLPSPHQIDIRQSKTS